jgi:hypothetical protein
MPTPLLSGLTFVAARGSAIDEKRAQVSSVRGRTIEMAHNWLSLLRADVELVAQDGDIREGFEYLAGTSDQGAALARTAKNLDAAVQRHSGARWFDDVLLVDRRGDTLYSRAGHGTVGDSVKSGSLGASPLHGACEAAVETGTAMIVDMADYPPIGGPHLFVAAPYCDGDVGQMLGAVCLHVSAQAASEAMAPVAGTVEGVPTYVVGGDLRLRFVFGTESEWAVTGAEVDTDAARRAVEGADIGAPSTRATCWTPSAGCSEPGTPERQMTKVLIVGDSPTVRGWSIWPTMTRSNGCARPLPRCSARRPRRVARGLSASF